MGELMGAATEQTEQAKALADRLISLDHSTMLRAPFETYEIGKLPKPYRSDSPKGECPECGKWHGLPAMHLDFVGHGYVTKRLLDVDPSWTWEPFALDDRGLPATDKHGNLWIRLTVLGVTRIGVGDGNSMKVLIGDAIRNAAMRFGVALDLWAHGSEDEKQQDGDKLPEPPAPALSDKAQAVLVELDLLPAEVRQKIVSDAELRSAGSLDAALEDDGWREWIVGAIEHHRKQLEEPT